MIATSRIFFSFLEEEEKNHGANVEANHPLLSTRMRSKKERKKKEKQKKKKKKKEKEKKRGGGGGKICISPPPAPFSSLFSLFFFFFLFSFFFFLFFCSLHIDANMPSAPGGWKAIAVSWKGGTTPTPKWSLGKIFSKEWPGKVPYPRNTLPGHIRPIL